MDWIDYFFDDDDLHFRGVVIPDKSLLNHEDFNQTHDDRLALFENSNGDWPTYVDALHSYFHGDFVKSKPSWPGKKAGLKRYPEYQGKSATFWHLLSEVKKEEERIPDFRRCERIRWPRPVIDHFPNTQPAQDDRILLWK